MQNAFLTTDPINEQALVNAVSTPTAGAIVTFSGNVRNHNKGKEVLYLEYEAYDAMALKKLEEVAQETARRFTLDKIALSHRTGRMAIGEVAVFIAVSSAHRPTAFDACRFAIDEIKREVPIWKKEFLTDGEVWVEGPGECDHHHDDHETL